MSSADLLEDDNFPHGTPAGFDAGCKSGGLCPNKGAFDAMTCKEAKTRYASDRDYRTIIDAGRPWVAKSAITKVMLATLAVDMDPAPSPAVPTPKPSNFETFKKPVAAVEISDELRDKLAAPDFPHGTNGGYQRGCNAAVEYLCPGDSDGRSCAQAKRDYAGVRRANLKTQAAKATLQKAGVSADRLDEAAAAAVALAEAGTVTAEQAADGLTKLALGGFDLNDYTTTDGPDIAVDGLVEALDDTRQRLTHAEAQITSLEEENDRLLKLTGTQTDTILSLRGRITEHERIAAADKAAAAAANSDIHQLNDTIAKLSKQLEQALRESIELHAKPAPAAIVAVPMTIDQPTDRVHLALDPRQAANVILALAAGGR